MISMMLSEGKRKQIFPWKQITQTSPQLYYLHSSYLCGLRKPQTQDLICIFPGLGIPPGYWEKKIPILSEKFNNKPEL